METYIQKQTKDKEVIKKNLSRRMVAVINGDLLKEDFEVIVNSVGVPISKGFGGFIAKNILKMTGDKIIQEAVDEAKRIYKTEEFSIGEFVTTSAGKWDKIKYIVHCHCPHYEENGHQRALTTLIEGILEFWDKNKVESVAFPPLSSGVLWFPIKDWAKAFFDGVMSFLDKKEKVKTCIKKLKIVILEEDKHKTFLAEWTKLYEARFGKADDDPGSEEHTPDELSEVSSDGEEVKKSAPKKPVGIANRKLSSSSEDSDVVAKKNQKPAKTQAKMIGSSSDDDKPSKAPPKKKIGSSSDSSDDAKKPAKPNVKGKTQMLDSSDDSDIPNKKPTINPKKKVDSSSDSSDSDNKKKPAVVKNTKPKKAVSSDDSSSS